MKDNLVINRVLRSWMDDKKGNNLFFLHEVKDGKLEINGESVMLKNGEGKTIAELDRNQEVTFTCTSVLFDLNLFAAQTGATKRALSSMDKAETPKIEVLEVKNHKVMLKETPKAGAMMTVGVADNGGFVATDAYLTKAAVAVEGKYAITGKEITVHTNISDGSLLFVKYKYEADKGIEITKNNDIKTIVGESVTEVMLCDPCNLSEEFYGYLIMPNGKLESKVTTTFDTESGQEFSIKGMQDYCSLDKQTFRLVVVEKSK